MKQIEQQTIQEIGIPSLVLMERASLAITKAIQKRAGKKEKIAILCGNGNNGGDGVACARQLYLAGYEVSIIMACIEETTPIEQALEKDIFSVELRQQLHIALHIGIPIYGRKSVQEYPILVDAVFGIGLKREITGELAFWFEQINREKHWVLAVDIPSGVCADNGKVLGTALYAKQTITFGFMKRGLLLYPGAEYAGVIEIEKADILRGTIPVSCFYYEKEDLYSLLPVRKSYSHKGSYGKIVFLAGSKNMSGASYLSAMASYRMGAGMVRIVTTEANREILQNQLPEAMLTTYEDEETEQNLEKIAKEVIDFADVLAVGPGLSTSKIAERLLKKVFYLAKEKEIPCVIDADALNIIAKWLTEELDTEFLMLEKNNLEYSKRRIEQLGKIVPKNTVITPHLGELERILSLPVKRIVQSLLDVADICTYNNEIAVVIKDARTIVAKEEKRYINQSGNHGMATAGSGDVLTGIIATLLVGKEPLEAACIGCYIHGLAGDMAAEKWGFASVMAGSLLEEIPNVLRVYER